VALALTAAVDRSRAAELGDEVKKSLQAKQVGQSRAGYSLPRSSGFSM
jgi:hypothetical protein